MKTEINGIKLEGTPGEIAEVINLAGLVKQNTYYPSVPVYPVSPFWYGTKITCDTVSRSPATGELVTRWHKVVALL